MTNINYYPALNLFFSHLTDEERLVLLCSRLYMPEDIKAEAGDLINNRHINWDNVLKIADIYGVLQFLYSNLQFFDENVPYQVKTDLREMAGKIFENNIKILGELKSLRDLMSNNGIEALFTKGIPLMMDVYKDAGSRVFSDIDILVKERDFYAIDKVLINGGFKADKDNDISGSYRSQRVYSLDNKYFLDVHKGFVGRDLHNDFISMDKDRMWRNKREVSMNGVSVDTLDIEHTLLYTCLHLSMQHGFFGLKWFVDINESVNRYRDGIDWEELIKLTKQYKVKRPLYYTLLFSKKLFNTQIPDFVLENLDNVKRKSDIWIFKRMSTNPSGTDYLSELFMFDTIQDMLKFVFLSLIRYPSQIKHFAKVSIRILNQLISGRVKNRKKQA